LIARKRSSGTGLLACSNLQNSRKARRHGRAIAKATADGATTVVGGGDTATAAKKFGVIDKSPTPPPAAALARTPEGKTLPGVAALSEK